MCLDCQADGAQQAARGCMIVSSIPAWLQFHIEMLISQALAVVCVLGLDVQAGPQKMAEAPRSWVGSQIAIAARSSWNVLESPWSKAVEFPCEASEESPPSTLAHQRDGDRIYRQGLQAPALMAAVPRTRGPERMWGRRRHSAGASWAGGRGPLAGGDPRDCHCLPAAWASAGQFRAAAPPSAYRGPQLRARGSLGGNSRILYITAL